MDHVADHSQTIADRIEGAMNSLTRAERQLALSMLESYPASGLGTLTTLAASAGVSIATVSRLVQKIGFKGFPDFQTALRDELTAKVKTPISKHNTWANAAPSEHILNRFTQAVIENIQATFSRIDPNDFDEACALLADTDRHLFIAGGRITHTLAEYLFLHMQVIRPNLTHVQSTSNTWPHYLLNAAEGDVFFIFDMRRYENNTLKMAEMAHARGAKIILMTDQWRSPVHQLAQVCLSNRIVVPSAWDSATTTMLLMEAMISAVETLNWQDSKQRFENLEDMFDQTKLFRKFT